MDGLHGILGRETFLLPVVWETERRPWKDEQWSMPVFSPVTGRVELRYPVPFDGTAQSDPAALNDDFDGTELALEWSFRRSPARPFHSLTESPGSLRLQLQPGAIADRARYSFAGIRQRDFQFEAVTRMDFSPHGEHEEAGVIVIQNDRSAFLATLNGPPGEQRLQLRQSLRGESRTIAEQPFGGGAVHLRITGDYLDYRFSWSADGVDWQPLGGAVDGTDLSPAVLGGFNYTGVHVGLYASSNGQPGGNHADFDFFRYRPTAADRDDWYHRQLQQAGGD